MLKAIGSLATVVVTSFYFFPFVFSFLPEANTKMVLAGIGLAVLGTNLARRRDAQVNKDFLVLSLWSLAVSFIGFVAVSYNNTADYAYATYFISMWVWLSGAYVVTRLIKCVHGHVSVQLVCHYLIAVCVGQCLLAFFMGQSPALKAFVDSFLASQGFMGRVENRLYGIGASLDVAGMRFAVILIIISYLCLFAQKKNSVPRMILYVLSFAVVAFIGNMIGRSTTIGFCLAIGMMVVVSFVKKDNRNVLTLWVTFGALLLILLPVIVYLYQTNLSIYRDIRFAFEGFFSLYETGRWEVHSNEVLKNMYVFPDNLRTWLIGDGYFDNPYDADPYYTGQRWHGFYMNTDVGYLRFIYYFGLFGLFAFAAFMYKAGKICMDRFSSQRLFLGLVLLTNFVMWFKVSSDLFLIFALFLCISKEENDAYEDCLAVKEPE